MSALAASDKGGLISRTLQGASVTLLVVNIALSTLVQCNVGDIEVVGEGNI